MCGTHCHIPINFGLFLFFHFSLYTQYQDETGIDSVKCKTCKVNTYQADDSSESVNHDEEADCLSCPRDAKDNLTMFAAQTESNVVQGCSACPAGKQAGSTVCVNCVVGQVSSSTTELKCEACDIGKYQSKPGLPSCFECIPGQYQNVQGGTSCKDCGIGQFRQSKKVLDSNGQLTDESTDPTTCVDCPKGSYQNEEGLAYCISCIPGQYQDAEGETKCRECQEGKHEAEPGAGIIVKRDTPTVCTECKYKCFFVSFHLRYHA